MFSSGSNPYDEIIGRSPPPCRLAHVRSPPPFQADMAVKATDENLASEDWGLNIEVCDKVGSDGAAGYVELEQSIQSMTGSS